MYRLVLVLWCVALIVSPAAGQFETRSASSVPQPPDAIAVGDFNHDGKLDLAVVDLDVTILLGNGDGTFREGAQYTIPTAENAIVTADLRKIGVLDLVVTSRLSQDVYVLLGNGDGTFQDPVAFPTVGYPLSDVEVDDFTSDGKLDIITCTGVTGTGAFVDVLPGNGDGTFGSAISTAIPNNIGCAAFGVGRFTSSSNLDLAIAGEFGSGGLDIMLGNGDGTFQPFGFYQIFNAPIGVAVADFSKDGNQDIGISSASGGLVVLLGNGDGTFQPPTTYQTPSLGPVVAADLSGKGNTDLVAPSGTPNGVAVFWGNGDGTFQPYVFFPAEKGDEYVAVGDFNGDLKLDLVNAAFFEDKVVTLLNTGVVTFFPTGAIGFLSQLFNTTSKPQTVKLTNTGTTALTISSMQVSGQFGMTSTCGSSVAAGASCNISVTFSPKSKGIKSGLITIHDSASTKPQVIELSGQGTVVQLIPPAMTFGSQKVGTKSNPQTVTLTNHGTTALSITNVSIGGANANDFVETNNCPSSLNAGANCTIMVTFDPSKTGIRKAQVSVADNGGGSPQTASLSGTGD